jgi:F5/8 type C domain
MSPVPHAHPSPAGGSSPGRRSRSRIPAAVGVLAALLAAFVVALSGPARAADPLISQGKPVLASSTENAGTPAANAVDGNAGIRWSSAFSDPQWIRVDLGATATVTQVVLNWESSATSSTARPAPSRTPRSG